MSRIRSKNTKPEKTVRSLLHKLGYRFRLHRKNLPGKPDIVLAKYHSIIFVHGCFWHRHKGCQFAYNPKSREDFWEEKFRKNIERDKEKFDELNKIGWTVYTVWECETRDIESLSHKIIKLLESPEKSCNS